VSAQAQRGFCRNSLRTNGCVSFTYLPSAYTRAPYYPQGLSTASLSPALYDTFAIVTRLSPGVRELLTDLEAHMHAVAEEFDRSR
jgi:hypothetical protein